MLIVGIAGGTGAGKSTVVRKIMERLPKNQVAVIPQDNYYKDKSHLTLEERRQLNFDHPDSIEFSLLIEQLKQLKKGEEIGVPLYSYLTCQRSTESIRIKPTKVVIVEGILIMSQPDLRECLDIKVFVDADADDRLVRCINRDILERGRNMREVLDRYETTVKPMHEQFIEPSKRFADIIVPQGGINTVAINVLADMILNNLQDRTFAF
ncbi:MAG: uridine kinase [Chitinophagales bacterium]